MRDVFSERQRELIRKLGPSMTSRELAALPEFDGFTRKRIYDKARHLKVKLGHKPRRYNKGIPWEDWEIEVVKAADGKRTIRSVRDELDRTWRSVYDKARDLGITLLTDK